MSFADVVSIGIDCEDYMMFGEIIAELMKGFNAFFSAHQENIAV